MNHFTVTYSALIAALFISTLSHAESVIQYDPRHKEIFNSWNFCIYCNLNEAILTPSTLYSGMHRNANISASYVYDTLMDNLDLTFAFMYSIRGERFSIKNSRVEMINLSYSDLPYFTFTGNKGALVNFTGSGLNYGNFRQANLEYPIFSGTALEDTDFTGAHFTDARFNNTWIAYTNFTDAHLVGADFTDADINHANFTRANLRDAIITPEQLQTSIICDAILPDGSQGPCLG